MGAAGAPRKRTPQEKDRLAVTVARLHFEDGLEHAEIAARLGVKVGEVAGYLRRARRNGLVALRVDDPGIPKYDAVISAMLERVCAVRRVVAVKTASAQPPETALADATAPRDRELHQRIASGAAHVLWDKIRDHDKIAVGTGRAVRFTVDALAGLAEAEPRSFTGIEIVSLTGTPVVRRDPHDLDSDAIASELGHILKVDGEAIHRANFKYIAKDPRAALRSQDSHMMEPEWEGGQAPDIALIGLGILDSRHHLMASRRDDKMIAPVRATLDQLEEIVLPVSSSAIMDLYDTFWVREDALEPPLAAIAWNLVEELNSKVVAVSRPKLDQTREKVIVAGGTLKYPGVLSYLRHTDAIGLRATTLVTDSTTAQHLVSDLTAEAGGPP